MFYTPKHCCECGEKIDRSEWKITASRRFCEVCESELKIYDLLPRLVFAFGLLGLIFGFGSFLKKTDQPLNVSTTPNVSVASNKNQNARNSQISATTSVQNSMPNAGVTDADGLTNREAQTVVLNQKPVQAGKVLQEDKQSAADEPVYFCGAQTKKGTPCSRRVKGGGRCWQHRGQPAMLPAEKLLASR